jgi:hypothetical protein
LTRREFSFRERDRNPVIAGWALHLFSGITFITLDVLSAMRAGEFEFAHNSMDLILLSATMRFAFAIVTSLCH